MEQAVRIICQQQSLIGIMHSADEAEGNVGVLIVVGGPQTRVGSHRQFVLLARYLASQGYPCLRFDYRGMGDSDGEQRDFELVGQDIKDALEFFQSEQPQLKRFVLWGLCDAASANLFYAFSDERIAGLVLLNPWVRTDSGEAQTYLKHYYLQRLLSKDLWHKLLSGKFNIKQSLSSFRQIVKKAMGKEDEKKADHAALTGTLPQRMQQAWERFQGPILLILSGQDLTAAEFKDVVKATPSWQNLLNQDKVQRKDLHEANHTFAKQQWRDLVAKWTVDWLKTI